MGLGPQHDTDTLQLIYVKYLTFRATCSGSNLHQMHGLQPIRKRTYEIPILVCILVGIVRGTPQKTLHARSVEATRV
jgi:hypothetical protein